MARELLGTANDDQSTQATASQNQVDPGAQQVKDQAQASGQESPVSPNEDLPGRRTYNPLSKFASYTYQLTLYMITPDAYDAFVSSGRRNINVLNNAGNSGAGAYIIAQSGGVNSTTSQRAPGFNLDVYIDDLFIDQAIGGQASQTATNVTNIKFTIVEPYGFSFISNLRRAADALKQYSQRLGKAKSQNPLRQFYIMAIRFNGYDINGNVVTELKNYDGTTNKSQDGFFETFYDILITGIKFKIDGRAIRYSIEARSSPPQAAFGAKRGILNNTSPIQASTVETALLGPNGLVTRLNKEQEDKKAKGDLSEANRYFVEFLGDSSALRNASIVSPADLDKYRWSGSGTQNSAQVNDASAATAVPNPTQRQITFAAGTSIMSAVQQIVTQSSYLEDALKVVYTTNLEPDPTKKDQPITQNNTGASVSWYTLNAKLSNARYDDTIGDFAYDITYLIQPYDTPALRQNFTNAGRAYTGAHKRYEYWFTGQNSEVLRYEQQLDALYYNAVLGNPKAKTFEEAIATPEGNSVGEGDVVDIPEAPGQRQPRSRLGKLNVGMEAQNAYLTDLYDPAGLVTAKVQILGDPDFLVQEQSSSLDAVYSKYYGTNGFTINPNGGQVFFEIDFKEGVDYNHSDGLFTINDQIRLWKYPPSVAKKIKGIAYLLFTVKSTFRGGAFTQELSAGIPPFGDPKENNGEGREEQREGSTASAPTATGTATVGSTGTRQDPPLSSRGAQPVNTPPATAGAGLVSGSGQASLAVSSNTDQVSGGQPADDDSRPPVGIQTGGGNSGNVQVRS